MKELTNAKRDFLTNCFAKEVLKPFLDKLLFEANAYKKPLSILLMDVDKFKSFNDKYGRPCGDEILKYFSSTLRLCLEGIESAPFRFGGDEFLLVFPGKSAKEIYPYAVRIMRNLKSRPFLFKGRQYRLSFSGAISSFPNDAKTVEALVESADKAMYFSKKHGRGKITTYSKIWQRKTVEVIAIVSVFIIVFGLATLFISGKKFSLDLAFLKRPNRINVIWTKSASFWEKYNPLNLFSKGTSKEKKRRIAIPRFRIPEKDLDLVYLKSGGVLRGLIVREDYDEIELKLILDEGEGMLVIKNFEIDRIERAERKAPAPYK